MYVNMKSQSSQQFWKVLVVILFIRWQIWGTEKSVKLLNVAYRNCFFYHQKTEKVSDIKSQIPGFQPQARQDTPYVCNLNYLKKGGRRIMFQSIYYKTLLWTSPKRCKVFFYKPQNFYIEWNSHFCYRRQLLFPMHFICYLSL